ncbi:MAG: tyrosine-protein phosphatase [Blastocatellia bacterium]|nr:tyrosine-protein phosphatase [Blastocatellia bacterium]
MKKKGKPLVAVKSEEIDNFYQVDKTLYRGAQPTKVGMVELKNLGIKTLVSLRSGTGDDLKRIGATGLTCLNVPVSWNPLRGPKDEAVVKFLQTVTDPANQPVFVHCRQGVDRTGVMMAAYRVVIQGWDKEEAIEEMQQVGSHSRYIKYEGYLKKMDVNKIRKELK